jgi:cell wall-associated NlpC family hydrolase
MFFVAWLLMGGGYYLCWCSVKHHNPITTVIDWTQGKPLKANWYVPIPTGEVADAMMNVGNIGVGAVSNWLNDLQGNADGTSQTTSAKRNLVVAFAMAQVGEPYEYGAAGPNKWDCSGLTMMAYKQAGINLPHSAATQGMMGKAVTSPQVGDLIFWKNNVNHVAMFLGNGKLIQAPKPGKTVEVVSLYDASQARYRSYI